MRYTFGIYVIEAACRIAGAKFVPIGTVFQADGVTVVRTYTIGSKDTEEEAIKAAYEGAVAIARELQNRPVMPAIKINS